jgi:hypothetical protein
MRFWKRRDDVPETDERLVDYLEGYEEGFTDALESRRRRRGGWFTLLLGFGVGIAASRMMTGSGSGSGKAERGKAQGYNAGRFPDPYSDAAAYDDETVASQQTTVGAPSDDPVGDDETRRRAGIPTQR